jgi:FAD/FMN-containing dehydrogenase
LSRELDGDLLRAGEPGFRAAKRLYDPQFDQVRPAAVVQTAGADDVATAIRFASRHGLVVRPRSGGHSYVGASTEVGCLQVDVRRINRVHYDPASQTVTVGSGATLFDVHSALDPMGRTIPTGTCATVGAAGLTLGGGMGVEDSAYGLTCDNLVELTVVTAAGEVLTVAPHRHGDLFWACRGGGGGNVGVVTSMRLRTWPAGPTGFYFLTFSDQQAERALAGWQSRVSRMPRSAWANLHLEASGGGVQARLVGVSLTGDAHAEAASMVSAVGASPIAATITSHSHLDGVKLLAGCLGESDGHCHLVPEGGLARAAFAAGSDVLGRPLRRRERGRLVSVVRQRGRSGRPGVVILDPLVGRTRDVGARATAFGWRDALAVAQWYVSLPSGQAPTARRDAIGWIAAGHRAVASSSVGGYVNYLEPGRRVASYYGANFGLMRRIRRRYDPDGLFDSPYSVPR